MNNSTPSCNKPLVDPDQARDISYSLRRYYVDKFHRDHFSDQDERVGLLLDLGGNKKGKRGLFDIDQYECSVVYANLSPTKRPDTVTDAACLPFRSGIFDTVICSELLEHVFSPKEVLAEVSRVLKTKGRVLICAPFMVGIHGDPYDYGRYTGSYWKRLLDDVGFECAEVGFQGSFYSVAFDMFRSWVYGAISHWGPERKLTISMIGAILGFMKIKAVKLDEKSCRDIALKPPSFTTGFGIKAIKK